MSDNPEQVIINRILESMERNEIVNTSYIYLEFHNGTLWLQGTVFSQDESTKAEWACWVDGVEAVDNRLVIYAGNQVEAGD